MPFQSEKQRRYLWANEPEIARDWTDTYGSRVQRDNGGIMHQFENYAHDDRDNVSVPRSFQARPQSDQVNLAYITPREEGILQSLKPGTPHRGPMEIPNYDSFDLSGGYATSGQLDAPTRGDIQAGVGSGGAGAGGERTNIGPLSSGAQQAWKDTQAGRDEYKKREALNLMNAQAVWGMPAYQKTTQRYDPRSKFNPLRFLGGAFKWPGRIASGIMGMGNKFNQWASNMRGGVSQKQWELDKQERIRQNRMEYLSGRKSQGLKYGEQTYKDLLAQGLEDPFQSAIDRDLAFDPNARISDTSFSMDQAMKPPESEYEGMWDNRGINAAIPSGWMANPEILRGLEAGQYAGIPIDKSSSMMGKHFGLGKTQQEKIAEGSGFRPEDIALAALSKEQKKSLVPNRASPGYSMMKLAFKNAQSMNSQQFDKWIDTTVLKGEYYDKLSDTLKFNETNEGRINMLEDDARAEVNKAIDLPGWDKQDEVNKAAASLLEEVRKVKNKYEHDDKAREKLSLSNKYYDNEKKFNDLGINSIKDLDKFFDAVYDQAKLSKPKDQMTVAHGGRISKALGGRSRDI